MEAYWKRLFSIGDKDGDGYLNRAELKYLLTSSGFRLNFSSVEEVLETCDSDGDGMIDFDEFVHMMMFYSEVVQRHSGGGGASQDLRR